jgi:2-dehydro-3-deoxygluconokinase
MGDMVDILALGEPMVEFNQTEGHASHTYLQGFGGDTSNALIAAARQGAKVGYLSALGNDRYAALLRELWDAEGVDHSQVRTNADAYTAIYFVTHDERGHHFDFFRKGSAASLMQPSDLNADLIRRAKVLHLSGISLAISESARSTCFAAIDLAKKAGVKVSFDTNLRLKLWPLDTARAVINQAVGLSDICLPSLDDVTAMMGLSSPDEVVDHCLNLGAKIVALKLGAQGALLATTSSRQRIAAFACNPVDATGAGDTFGGAFIARIVAGDTVVDAGRYAAAAAALSTEGYGAVAPIPLAAKVQNKLHGMT